MLRYHESGSGIDPEAYLSYLHYLQYLMVGDEPGAETSFNASFQIYKSNFKKRQNELSAINRKILADGENYDREICLKLLSESDLQFSDSSNMEKAWFLIESSKSAQLNLNLGLQTLLGIKPDLDSMVLKSFTLKSNISDYEKSYKAAVKTSLSSDQQQVIILSDKIKLAQDELDATIGNIDRRYPELYRRIFNENIVPVYEIQRTLKSDECILNYYLTDTVIYSMLVSLDTVMFHDQKYEKTDVLSTISSINQPNFTESGDVMFKRLNKGYELLIGPMESHLKPRIKIIPAGILHGLPFEGLVTENRKGKQISYTYLLDKYEFSYGFTGRAGQNVQPKVSTQNFVFSPFTVPGFNLAVLDGEKFRTDTNPLIHSLKEAKMVSTLTKGRHLDEKELPSTPNPPIHLHPLIKILPVRPSYPEKLFRRWLFCLPAKPSRKM